MSSLYSNRLRAKDRIPTLRVTRQILQPAGYRVTNKHAAIAAVIMVNRLCISDKTFFSEELRDWFLRSMIIQANH